MSASTRTDGVLRVGEPAPDVALAGAAGPVQLAALWAESPLVVSFLRHFG
jgi:hypothetical protein